MVRTSDKGRLLKGGGGGGGRSRSRAKVRKQCEYIVGPSGGNTDEPNIRKGTGSVLMNRFKKDLFCGRRGGTSFKESIRPSADGKCPESTVACSGKTSPDNTVCVTKKNKSDCPINFMTISDEKSSDKDQISIQFSHLRYSNRFKGGFSETAKYLVYSKLDKNMAVMSTKLSPDTPCITDN